jgi:hypothetical protein
MKLKEISKYATSVAETAKSGKNNQQKIREFIQQEKRRWRMQEEREIARDNWWGEGILREKKRKTHK